MRRVTGAAALMLAGLAALPAATAADTGEIRLTIDGEAATRFEGECVLTTAEGERRIGLDGSVPLETRFEGSAIACRIQQSSEQGYLRVELRGGGNVSRSLTQGAGSTIRLRLG